MFTTEEFHREYADSNMCLEKLFQVRFPDPHCPKCMRRGAYHRHPTKQCYTCNCGQSHIYPRKGTIFENSPLPLSTWLYALYLMAQHPHGISIKDLQKNIDVTYVTAWKMAKKIRPAMPGEWLNHRSCFDSLLTQCMKRSEVVSTSV